MKLEGSKVCNDPSEAQKSERIHTDSLAVGSDCDARSNTDLVGGLVLIVKDGDASRNLGNTDELVKTRGWIKELISFDCLASLLGRPGLGMCGSRSSNCGFFGSQAFVRAFETCAVVGRQTLVEADVNSCSAGAVAVVSGREEVSMAVADSVTVVVSMTVTSMTFFLKLEAYWPSLGD